MDDKLSDSLQKYISVYQPALIMFSCFVKLFLFYHSHARLKRLGDLMAWTDKLKTVKTNPVTFA